jgi:hypothetical protein
MHRAPIQRVSRGPLLFIHPHAHESIFMIVSPISLQPAAVVSSTIAIKIAAGGAELSAELAFFILTSKSWALLSVTYKCNYFHNSYHTWIDELFLLSIIIIIIIIRNESIHKKALS